MIRTRPTFEKPGDIVIDVGCRLTQRLRETVPSDHPVRMQTVKKVFRWGLRLDDDTDCGHWILCDLPDVAQKRISAA